MQPGDTLWWHYRPPAWRPGDAEAVQPTTVVEDSPTCLVVWLAAGTTVLKPVLPDGAEVRTLPVAERFRAGRAGMRRIWQGEGVLRIAPAGRPWTVSLFRTPDGTFLGWYVNLEQRRGRLGDHVLATDHVLDLWIDADADGEARLKDEDELDAAVLGGRFTDATARRIVADAARARDAFERRDPEFATEWTTWQPPSCWTVPDLPREASWDYDLVATPI